MHMVIMFKSFSETNGHIYISEDKMWAAKGRFSQAMLDEDPISWDVSDKGNFTLSVLVVSI